MCERTELTHEVRARLTYASKLALDNRAKNTPEAKAIIRDYLDAISPQTVLALLEENERFRAMISDLLCDKTNP